MKSASLDTEMQGSDLIWDRAGPFLCFWQAQTMLSFYHRRQNGCGSRISWMLDLGLRLFGMGARSQQLGRLTLGTGAGRDTTSVRARKAPEQH